MIETRLLFNRQGKRRILHFAMTFMILLQLTGCAVGYRTFQTEDWNSTQPTPNLSNVKISYSYYHLPGFDENIGGVVDGLLRSRFHILDIQSKADIHNETDRFVISVMQVAGKTSLPGEFFGIASYFTFAVLPSFWDEDHSVVFTIIAPGGEEKTYRYRLIERSYSWLPFLFFGPGFVVGGSGSYAFYDKEKHTKTLEDITAHFMMEAAPFLLSHLARQTQ